MEIEVIKKMKDEDGKVIVYNNGFDRAEFMDFRNRTMTKDEFKSFVKMVNYMMGWE